MIENYCEENTKTQTKTTCASPKGQDLQYDPKTPKESPPLNLDASTLRSDNSSSDTVLEGESNERICDLPPLKQVIAGAHLISCPVQPVVVKLEDTVQDLNLQTSFQISSSPIFEQKFISALDPSSPKRQLSSKRNMFSGRRANTEGDLRLVTNNRIVYRSQQATPEANLIQDKITSPVNFKSEAKLEMPLSIGSDPKCESPSLEDTLRASSPVKNCPALHFNKNLEKNVMLSHIPDFDINSKPYSRPHSTNNLIQPTKIDLQRRPATLIGTVEVSKQSQCFSKSITLDFFNTKSVTHLDEFDETISQLKHKLSFVDDNHPENIKNDPNHYSPLDDHDEIPFTNLLESLHVPHVRNDQNNISDFEDERLNITSNFKPKKPEAHPSQSFDAENIQCRSISNDTECISPSSDTTVHISDNNYADYETLSTDGLRAKEFSEQKELLSRINDRNEEKEEKSSITVDNSNSKLQVSLFHPYTLNNFETPICKLLSNTEQRIFTHTDMAMNPGSLISTPTSTVSVHQSVQSAPDLKSFPNCVNRLMIGNDVELTTFSDLPTNQRASKPTYQNMPLPYDLHYKMQNTDQYSEKNAPSKKLRRSLDETDILGTNNKKAVFKRQRNIRVGLSKKVKVKPLHPNLYNKKP